MRSRRLTGQKEQRFSTSVRRIEQHLVFKVLFLQVLHKRDHFVDDWVQHWLEAGQKTVGKSRKTHDGAVLHHAVTCRNVAVSAHLDDVGVQVFCTNTKRLD